MLPNMSRTYFRLSTGLVLLIIAACVLAQDTYPLDTGDRLRIIVHDRPDLSGVYTVGDAGELSIPLVGRVTARGANVQALETELTRVLASRQSAKPHVAVEVEAYRPVYVEGDVAKPGAYTFVPRLTVRQAVALAGGRLSTRNATTYTAVDRAREEETLVTLLDVYLADVVREARLISERDSHPVVRFPGGLSSRLADARIREALTSEAELFKTRAALVEGQVDLLSERILQFGSQISELDVEKRALIRKRKLTQERLSAMESLRSKGVMAHLDVLQMEINSIEAERELRENSVLTLDAILGRNEAQQNIANLHARRAEEISGELVAVRNRLAQNLSRIRNTMVRLNLMTSGEPDAWKAANEADFRITRREGNASTEFHAQLDTPLRPGDTLSVPFPRLDLNGLGELGLPERLPDRPAPETEH
jgi:protein involved in polysaccharide export with SLBB domain